MSTSATLLSLTWVVMPANQSTSQSGVCHSTDTKHRGKMGSMQCYFESVCEMNSFTDHFCMQKFTQYYPTLGGISV